MGKPHPYAIWAGIAGLLLVVVTATVTVIGLGVVWRESRDSLEGPCGPPPDVDRATLFDPLVRQARMDWLPAGFEPAETDSTTTEYMALFLRASSNNYSIEVRAWVAGQSYWERTGDDAGFGGTAQVNGRPAQWRPFSGADGGGVLRWEYQPRSWAQVIVHWVDREAEAVAHRVAENVRFGGGERIRLPWRLTGVPDGLTPMYLHVAENHPVSPWRVELTFEGTREGLLGRCPVLNVRSTRGEPGPNPSIGPGPELTVNGYPAWRNGTSSITLYGPADISHTVKASESVLRQLGPDGVVGFAAGMELYGDPATWTDRPLG